MQLDRKIGQAQYTALVVLGLLIFLSAWALLTYTGFIRSFFLPTPTKVLSAIILLLAEGSLLADIFASLYRILLGFLLSLVIALPLGLALGVSRKFEALTESLISFIR